MKRPQWTPQLSTGMLAFLMLLLLGMVGCLTMWGGRDGAETQGTFADGARVEGAADRHGNLAPAVLEKKRLRGPKRRADEPDRAAMGLSTEAIAAILGTWTYLGPGNIGGRTRGLLIDPLNPATMYAAGVAGGVWKTTNSGQSWTPLMDSVANLAVASLAMEPSNTSVIYAGTGEGVFNGDAVRGAGIFKTTDAGASWQHLASTNTADFYYVNKIVVSPNNSQRVYAATRTGVWRSLNGGSTWTRVLDPGAVNGCLDLTVRTDQATDYIFAACGTFVQATVYRNVNAAGSSTWTAVLSEPGMGRTSLAIAPSNQAIIYALAASVASGQFQNGLHAVLRSDSSGDPGTWTAQVRNSNATKLNTVLLTNPVFAFYQECSFGPSSSFFNQGWYDNVIAVDPAGCQPCVGRGHRPVPIRRWWCQLGYGGTLVGEQQLQSPLRACG